MEKKFSIRIITVILFLVLAIAGIGFSLYLLYIAKTMYMYILAIAFTILAIVSSFFNIFASMTYYRSYFYNNHLKEFKLKLPKFTTYPAVAIVMAVYNEQADEVKKSMLKLKEMKYEKSKLHYYMLDDSTKPELASELKKFCVQNNIMYIHREVRKGFKAGAINNALKYIKEEFIALFDYDEYLINKNFLLDLIPYFADKKVAFVQTEKRYRYAKSLFAQSVSLFDAFFFKFIQQARALNNTAIFAGSCGIIRKSALIKCKGFPEYVIEDTFFSFLSDLAGYKSIYVPKIYAKGEPIQTFSALMKQQWRYNYGDTQFLNFFYKHRHSKRLTPLSYIDYFTHGFGLNYISIVLLLFTLVSVLIVFSAIQFVPMSIQQVFEARYLGIDLEIFGVIAFVLSLIAPVIITKIYFNSIKKGIMIFFLNFALAVIRTKAAFAAIFKRNPSMMWSKSIKASRSRLFYAVSNTKIELLSAFAFAILGYIAFSHKNISGALWLFWYAVLYMLATIFLYKYR
ncbi:MAG: glycosyltransferase [Candidatus Micrarchaeaceae archaeon]